MFAPQVALPLLVRFRRRPHHQPPAYAIGDAAAAAAAAAVPVERSHTGFSIRSAIAVASDGTWITRGYTSPVILRSGSLPNPPPRLPVLNLRHGIVLRMAGSGACFSAGKFRLVCGFLVEEESVNLVVCLVSPDCRERVRWLDHNAGGGGGGGGGISPSKLRLMLLGVEKRRKEEEELEARRSLRSEVPDVDDRCVGFSETCKDVGMVCSLPESSTLSTGMASGHHPSKDFAVGNVRVPVCQGDVPFEADSASSSVFEFQRAERAQQHWPAFVPPFGKPAPSKWDDAQKWIGSPTSNRSSKSSSGGQPKRMGGGILGHGNRQCTTKVLEITEEADTKRIDPSQSKKEAAGQRTVNWVPDPFPVVDQCAKPVLVLDNSVADSAVSLSRHDSSTLFNISTAFVTPPSTVRSVSMRDMGTEMTPVASQDPSRTGTPVRATTPTRSPASSRPSSPGRVAPSSSPIHSVDHQEGSSMKELSEKELQMKTRREIMVLGTQLGKPNIAAWASKEEEDRNMSASHEIIPVDQSAESIIEIRASAWEEAEKAKYLARLKREEIKIQAWEDHQKAKTEAEMRKIEVEVERMRADAHDRLMNKLATTRHKAEVKRAAAEARRNRQAARTEQQAEYIRRTGRVPSSFSCWSWCE